ncbi:MAG: DciA family protein [Pyrinomonadaceae bacterium]
MEQLFGAIPSVLRGLGPNADIDEAVAFAAWGRCAGDLLRERTATVEFFGNRLVVAVQDKTWQRHLEELSPQMLVRINGSLGHGSVKYIEFRIDAAAVEALRESNKAAKTDLVLGAVSPSLRKAANAIADEHLREQFLSAAASYLAKQTSNIER